MNTKHERAWTLDEAMDHLDMTRRKAAHAAGAKRTMRQVLALVDDPEALDALEQSAPSYLAGDRYGTAIWALRKMAASREEQHDDAEEATGASLNIYLKIRDETLQTARCDICRESLQRPLEWQDYGPPPPDEEVSG